MAWTRIAFRLRLAVSVGLCLASVVFLLYPACVVSLVAMDPGLGTSGQSRFASRWFRSVSRRYASWAGDYLESRVAESLHHGDVAATEWPMFGSVFYLVAAEELQKQGALPPPNELPEAIRKAVQRAVEVVVSPVTATWVQEKWGDTYLEEQNVFYRMLLIMGLAAYERVTGDHEYREMMSGQREALSEELREAPFHHRDDYPGECYPNDVLWAVAAIRRAADLEGIPNDDLASALIGVLNGPFMCDIGFPAYQVDAPTGTILQEPRGCGNAGILQFAAELDSDSAVSWYSAFETHFWYDRGWVVGFREHPQGPGEELVDVDSGPVVFGIGSVASAFGIGAARSVGRFDHAAPLTMEAVAAAWPTPFGFLIPGLMGWAAADSWCLGEVALLFVMTRPVCVEQSRPFTGWPPLAVWLMVCLYGGTGLGLIALEVRWWRSLRRRLPDGPAPENVV